jgi:hypothetical protein
MLVIFKVDYLFYANMTNAKMNKFHRFAGPFFEFLTKTNFAKKYKNSFSNKVLEIFCRFKKVWSLLILKCFVKITVSNYIYMYIYTCMYVHQCIYLRINEYNIGIYIFMYTRFALKRNRNFLRNGHPETMRQLTPCVSWHSINWEIWAQK